MIVRQSSMRYGCRLHKPCYIDRKAPWRDARLAQSFDIPHCPLEMIHLRSMTWMARTSDVQECFQCNTNVIVLSASFSIVYDHLASGIRTHVGVNLRKQIVHVDSISVYLLCIVLPHAVRMQLSPMLAVSASVWCVRYWWATVLWSTWPITTEGFIRS